MTQSTVLDKLNQSFDRVLSLIHNLAIINTISIVTLHKRLETDKLKYCKLSNLSE